MLVTPPLIRNGVAGQNPVAKDAFPAGLEIRQFVFFRLGDGRWRTQKRDDPALFDNFHLLPLCDPTHHIAKGVPELSDVCRFHV
jgi:hypothetical protein